MSSFLNQLDCAQCNSKYEVGIMSAKQPVILPCLHKVCRGCVVAGAGSFPCPACGAVCTTPANELPLDYGTMAAIAGHGQSTKEELKKAVKKASNERDRLKNALEEQRGKQETITASGKAAKVQLASFADQLRDAVTSMEKSMQAALEERVASQLKGLDEKLVTMGRVVEHAGSSIRLCEDQIQASAVHTLEQMKPFLLAGLTKICNNQAAGGDAYKVGAEPTNLVKTADFQQALEKIRSAVDFEGSSKADATAAAKRGGGVLKETSSAGKSAAVGTGGGGSSGEPTSKRRKTSTPAAAAATKVAQASLPKPVPAPAPAPASEAVPMQVQADGAKQKSQPATVAQTKETKRTPKTAAVAQAKETKSPKSLAVFNKRPPGASKKGMSWSYQLGRYVPTMNEDGWVWSTNVGGAALKLQTNEQKLLHAYICPDRPAAEEAAPKKSATSTVTKKQPANPAPAVGTAAKSPSAVAAPHVSKAAAVATEHADDGPRKAARMVGDSSASSASASAGMSTSLPAPTPAPTPAPSSSAASSMGAAVPEPTTAPPSSAVFTTASVAAASSGIAAVTTTAVKAVTPVPAGATATVAATVAKSPGATLPGGGSGSTSTPSSMSAAPIKSPAAPASGTTPIKTEPASSRRTSLTGTPKPLEATESAQKFEVLDWTKQQKGNGRNALKTADGGKPAVSLVLATLAQSAEQVRWRNVPKNDSMKLCKSFSLPNGRWSSGFLQLIPNGQKDTTSTKNNFLIFSITRGELDVTIHHTTIRLKEGGTFFVPPTNFYSLKCVGTETSLIAFTQIKVEYVNGVLAVHNKPA